MDADAASGASGVTDRKETDHPMQLFSNWIKSFWHELNASNDRSGHDAQPPRIQQRLNRYTNS